MEELQTGDVEDAKREVGAPVAPSNQEDDESGGQFQASPVAESAQDGGVNTGSLFSEREEVEGSNQQEVVVK